MGEVSSPPVGRGDPQAWSAKVYNVGKLIGREEWTEVTIGTREENFICEEEGKELGSRPSKPEI